MNWSNCSWQECFNAILLPWMGLGVHFHHKTPKNHSNGQSYFCYISIINNFRIVRTLWHSEKMYLWLYHGVYLNAISANKQVSTAISQCRWEYIFFKTLSLTMCRLSVLRNCWFHAKDGISSFDYFTLQVYYPFSAFHTLMVFMMIGVAIYLN